jgi:murein DD-endopeptidase MepM/ murein hydrolase activator NlpD
MRAGWARRRVGLLAAVFGTWVARAEGGALRVEPQAVPPGGIAVVRLAEPVASATAGGKQLRFFWSGKESIALVGVDLQHPPGRLGLEVHSLSGKRFDGEIRVNPKRFPVERLTVPERFTKLDRKTLARVRKEAARLEQLWSLASPEPLWDGAFVAPASGNPGSPFGLRRFFNGQPRSPHAGIDIRAPEGAPVVAANRGRVALAEELFFAGKTVVLDHGLGLYTVYVHLSQIAVRPGELVAKGSPIGRVGATGRATGPHLHFAVRVGEARVDPEFLLGRAVGGPGEESEG